MLYVRSLECRFPAGRALPILFPLLFPACVGGGIPRASLLLPTFSRVRMELCPPPGPPSLSRVLACVLQDGFHGACLVSVIYWGQPQTVKPPFIVLRLCLYSYPCLFHCVSDSQVPLLPQAPTADRSSVPSGFHRALFLCSPAMWWWLFSRGWGPLHLVRGTLRLFLFSSLLHLTPAVFQLLIPWSYTFALFPAPVMF